MSADDDLGVLLAGVSEALLFLARVKKSAERALSERYPQVLGDWRPGQSETLTDWCCPGGPADKAARTRVEGRNGGVKPSESEVCAELAAMWKQAGRHGGTPRSIKELRSRQR